VATCVRGGARRGAAAGKQGVLPVKSLVTEMSANSNHF
jgi:hypothetical protein